MWTCTLDLDSNSGLNLLLRKPPLRPSGRGHLWSAGTGLGEADRALCGSSGQGLAEAVEVVVGAELQGVLDAEDCSRNGEDDGEGEEEQSAAIGCGGGTQF